MKLHSLACGLLLGLALSSATAAKETWPKMVGGENSRECHATLRRAKQVYASNAFFLYSPKVQKDFGFTSVVGRRGFRSFDTFTYPDLQPLLATSFDVNDKLFAKLLLPEKFDTAEAHIYWQSKIGRGFRLVIEERQGDLPGDTYHVRFVPQQTSVKDYFAFSDTWEDELITNSLGSLPPLIFRKNFGNDLFVIDVNPYEALAKWRLFATDAGRSTPVCTIQFRPGVAKSGLAEAAGVTLLPKPVQLLDSLFTAARGDPWWGEASSAIAYQSTAMEEAWLNAALRPWARTEFEYSRHNTEAETKSELGAARYDSMMAQYALAELSLVEYYRQEFHMSLGRAKSVAKVNMDIAFRTWDSLFRQPA